MNDIVTNWTKICIGLAIVIVAIGVTTGHIVVSENGWLTIVSVLAGGHAVSSGLGGLINSDKK